MGFGIKVLIEGDRACFTRPEMKSERVSYDVMTPSAARGILEAVYWKPAIVWRIDSIEVLNEIVFDTFRRNEVANKLSYRSAKSAFDKGSAVAEIASDRKGRRNRHSRETLQHSVKAFTQRPVFQPTLFRLQGVRRQCVIVGR